MDIIASGKFVKFKKKSVEDLQIEIDNQLTYSPCLKAGDSCIDDILIYIKY